MPRRGARWVVVTVGLAGAPAMPAAVPAEPPAAPTAPASTAFSDQDLQLAARRALRVMIGEQALQIDVTARDAVVTLSGRVDELPYRPMARDAVATVEGVRRVVDALGALPQAGSDQELARLVSGVLRASPATANANVLVRSRNHVVSLDGEVETQAIAERAENLALGVRGVTAVSNGLHRPNGPAVVGQEPPELREALLRRIPRDPETDVEVAVSGRAVTLRGRVALVEQRRQVIEAAWAAGAGRVEAQALTVAWWQRQLAGPRPTPAAGAPVDRDLARALVDDPRFTAMPIQVQVQDATATLRGRVATDALLRIAEAIARDTESVRRVVSYLRVDGALIGTDAALADLVRAHLRREPFIDAAAIAVAVKDGQVQLTGTVGDDAQVTRVPFLAAGAPGVRSVESELHVAGRHFALGP
jgi:osmotically-inducible protein OsmY